MTTKTIINKKRKIHLIINRKPNNIIDKQKEADGLPFTEYEGRFVGLIDDNILKIVYTKRSLLKTFTTVPTMPLANILENDEEELIGLRLVIIAKMRNKKAVVNKPLIVISEKIVSMPWYSLDLEDATCATFNGHKGSIITITEES